MNIFTILLSGAVVASLVTSTISLYKTHISYRYAYYKMVVDKRVEAYEELYPIISELKIALIDKSQGYHHVLGVSVEDARLFHLKIITAMSNEFWLTNDTRKSLLSLQAEFIRCFYLHEVGEKNLIEVGKEEYKYIGGLRDKLEINILNDLPDLYKVKKFFKSKKIETKYTQKDISERPN